MDAILDTNSVTMPVDDIWTFLKNTCKIVPMDYPETPTEYFTCNDIFSSQDKDNPNKFHEHTLSVLEFVKPYDDHDHRFTSMESIYRQNFQLHNVAKPTILSIIRTEVKCSYQTYTDHYIQFLIDTVETTCVHCSLPILEAILDQLWDHIEFSTFMNIIMFTSMFTMLGNISKKQKCCPKRVVATIIQKLLHPTGSFRPSPYPFHDSKQLFLTFINNTESTVYTKAIHDFVTDSDGLDSSILTIDGVQAVIKIICEDATFIDSQLYNTMMYHLTMNTDAPISIKRSALFKHAFAASMEFEAKMHLGGIANLDFTTTQSLELNQVISVIAEKFSHVENPELRVKVTFNPLYKNWYSFADLRLMAETVSAFKL